LAIVAPCQTSRRNKTCDVITGAVVAIVGILCQTSRRQKKFDVITGAGVAMVDNFYQTSRRHKPVTSQKLRGDGG